MITWTWLATINSVFDLFITLLTAEFHLSKVRSSMKHLCTMLCYRYISVKKMKQVTRKVDLTHRGKRFTPSVIQIRYRGFKGVLAINPRVPADIEFRKSMDKFPCRDNRFYVADYSRPYSFGRLNQQVSALLSALGISDQVLLDLQRNHYQWLETFPYDAELAIQHLCSVDQVEAANELAVLVENDQDVSPQLLAQLLKLQGEEMAAGKEAEKGKLDFPAVGLFMH